LAGLVIEIQSFLLYFFVRGIVVICCPEEVGLGFNCLELLLDVKSVVCLLELVDYCLGLFVNFIIDYFINLIILFIFLIRFFINIIIIFINFIKKYLL
jgi:hypothetical protein